MTHVLANAVLPFRSEQDLLLNRESHGIYVKIRDLTVSVVVKLHCNSPTFFEYVTAQLFWNIFGWSIHVFKTLLLSERAFSALSKMSVSWLQ